MSPRSQQTEPAAKGSADSSAGSSTSSSSSSPYAASAGPGFDPGKPPPNAQERPGEDAPEALEEWEEKQVTDWLKNAGDLAHAAFGVGEYDWVMTRRDLERIGPPATRILNRYQPTRAIAGYSDAGAVAIGFGLYGWRSTLERIETLKAQKAAEGPGAPSTAAEAVVQAPPAGVSAAPLAANGEGPAATGPTWAEQLRATRPDEEAT